MSDPSSSTAYRNPTVEEEDDDLDDLDGMLWLLGKGADLADVLASFNKPTTAAPQTPGPSSSRPRGGSADTNLADASPQAARVGAGGADEEDFEASLVEGMESLLRQLAGDHPPGPAPGETKIDGVASRSAAGPGGPAGTSGLSPAEEEEAWQKALEMMLSGEGLSALGIDPASAMAGAKGSGALATAGGPSQSNAPPRPAGQPGAADQPSFEETIRRTMESLKTGGEGSRAAASGEASDLAKLLEQLGSDPSLLDGLGNGDGDELGGLLDGMMSQLMTKEVLEEPMAELASKYPAYLASPPAGVSPASLEKYKQQHIIVDCIVALFRKPDFSDERDGKEVARLVGEMQDLGGPPEEVLGEMPEGFDMAKMLGGEGDESCVIM